MIAKGNKYFNNSSKNGLIFFANNFMANHSEIVTTNLVKPDHYNHPQNSI